MDCEFAIEYILELKITNKWSKLISQLYTPWCLAFQPYNKQFADERTIKSILL